MDRVRGKRPFSIVVCFYVVGLPFFMDGLMLTGSRRITANAMSATTPQVAEQAVDALGHSGAILYHLEQQGIAERAGKKTIAAAHDEAAVAHKAAINRPKSWGWEGQPQSITDAHDRDAARLSAFAQYQSRRANRLGRK